MLVVWMASSFCYYLISYQLKYLHGNIFINGIVSSSSEILAYCTSGVMVMTFKIKNTLIFSYALAFLGMAALIAYNDDN